MIAIVNYEAGNLTSVQLALGALGATSRITRDPAEIRAADRVVFPGQGAAGPAMQSLVATGLATTLRDVLEAGTPFLGICVGMQLLFTLSDENGGTTALDCLSGRVQRFISADPGVKIPHMGWNSIRLLRAHPLFASIEDGSEFYFVHSFYCSPEDPAIVVASSNYASVDFPASVARANLFATQFHPERSGRLGLQIYENFLKWTGTC